MRNKRNNVQRVHDVKRVIEHRQHNTMIQCEQTYIDIIEMYVNTTRQHLCATRVDDHRVIVTRRDNAIIANDIDDIESIIVNVFDAIAMIDATRVQSN